MLFRSDTAYEMCVGDWSSDVCSSDLPSPGDLPDPGIEPGSPALQADALPSEPPGKPLWEHITKKLGQSFGF